MCVCVYIYIYIYIIHTYIHLFIYLLIIFGCAKCFKNYKKYRKSNSSKLSGLRLSSFNFDLCKYMEFMKYGRQYFKCSCLMLENKPQWFFKAGTHQADGRPSFPIILIRGCFHNNISRLKLLKLSTLLIFKMISKRCFVYISYICVYLVSISPFEWRIYTIYSCWNRRLIPLTHAQNAHVSLHLAVVCAVCLSVAFWSDARRQLGMGDILSFAIYR